MDWATPGWGEPAAAAEEGVPANEYNDNEKTTATEAMMPVATARQALAAVAADAKQALRGLQAVAATCQRRAGRCAAVRRDAEAALHNLEAAESAAAASFPSTAPLEDLALSPAVPPAARQRLRDARNAVVREALRRRGRAPELAAAAASLSDRSPRTLRDSLDAEQREHLAAVVDRGARQLLCNEEIREKDDRTELQLLLRYVLFLAQMEDTRSKK